MRTVLPLAFVALIAASTAAFGIEPVTVGGDFGTAWLKNLPYQPAADTDGNDTGLWSWGSTPRWMNVVNGTLEPIVVGDDEVDFAGIAWLGADFVGASVELNESVVPKALSQANVLSPYYSDDPWVLAQHYGVPIRTDKDWYNDI